MNGQNDKNLAMILFQLFQVLEDKTVTPEEGAQLCSAIAFLCMKIKPKLPKFWQRFLIDSVANALQEAEEYFKGLK